MGLLDGEPGHAAGQGLVLNGPTLEALDGADYDRAVERATPVPLAADPGEPAEATEQPSAEASGALWTPSSR